MLSIRAIALALTGSSVLAIASCENLPGHPSLEPIEVPNPGIGEPKHMVGAQWVFPFRTPEARAMSPETFYLELWTRVDQNSETDPPGREYYVKAVGSPANNTIWVIDSAQEAQDVLDDIAAATYMVLPSNPNDLAALYAAVSEWIDTEWMSPESYYALHGK